MQENIAVENPLGTEKIGKLMVSLALPSVAAQLINVLYNVVDRIYIGHIPNVGSLALTGLGVCAPILMLVSAFSAFAGMGGAPLAAIALGADNRKEAEKILGSSVIMLLFLSVVLTVGFQIFKTPILYAFGASDTLIPYSLDYITIYLWGTISVQLSLGLNTFITAQGKARTAMLSVLIGAVANIVLDPIFIFTLNMGVKGAALATIISQTISAVWVVSFLTSKKTLLRIKRENMHPDARVIKKIASLGISPFIMQSTESLVSITLNSGMQRYGGDMYVGSITVLQSVMQMIMFPIQGFSQGVQPIISYNYGANNMARVRGVFKRALCVYMTVVPIGALLTMTMPKLFASIFTDDPELIALVGKAMPIFMFGMLIFGLQMASQMMFMGMGKAKQSLFLALMRKVILLVPLAIIIPSITKSAMSIYYAEPIADIISATVAVTLFMISRKQLLYNEK